MNAQTGLAHDDRGSGSGDIVLSLDALRIQRALARRQRYKYVHPRVVPEGLGWKIVSPNCSRTVDPEGGEIDIAWLRPREKKGKSSKSGKTDWQLHARDHVKGRWHLSRQGPLHELLDLLCTDPAREFWR